MIVTFEALIPDENQKMTNPIDPEKPTTADPIP